MSIANQRRVTQVITDTITDYFTNSIGKITDTYLRYELSKQGKGKKVENIPVRLTHVFAKKLQAVHFISFWLGKEQGLQNIEDSHNSLSFSLNLDTSSFAEFISNKEEQRKLRTQNRFILPKRSVKFANPDYAKSSNKIIERDINHKLNILETFKELETKEDKEPYSLLKGNIDINYTKFGKTYLSKRQNFLAEKWNRDLTESTKKSINRFNNRYKKGGNYESAIEEVINDLYNDTNLKIDTGVEALSKGTPSVKQDILQSRLINRIRKIVVTETNALYNLGILDEYLTRGYTKVRWTAGFLEMKFGPIKGPKTQVRLKNTGRKHEDSTPKAMRTGRLSQRTCDFCISMDGKIFSISDLMSPRYSFSGNNYPKPVEGTLNPLAISQLGNKIPMIPAHPYCGCFWVPISDDIEKGTEATGAVNVASQPDIDPSRYGLALAGGIASTMLMYALFRAYRPALRNISSTAVTNVQNFGKANNETIKTAYSEAVKAVQENESVITSTPISLSTKETPDIPTEEISTITEQVKEDIKPIAENLGKKVRDNDLEQFVDYNEMTRSFVAKQRENVQLQSEIRALLDLPDLDTITIRDKLNQYKQSSSELVEEVSDLNVKMNEFNITAAEIENAIVNTANKRANYLSPEVKKEIVDNTDAIQLINEFRKSRELFLNDRNLINKSTLENIVELENALIKQNFVPFTSGQIKGVNNAILGKIKNKPIAENLDNVYEGLKQATTELSSLRELDDLVYKSSKSLGIDVKQYRKGFNVPIRYRSIEDFRKPIRLNDVQDDSLKLFLVQGKVDEVFVQDVLGRYILNPNITNSRWSEYLNKFENTSFKPRYSKVNRDIGYKDLYKSSRNLYKRAKGLHKSYRKELDEVYDTISQEFNLVADKDFILEYLDKTMKRSKYTTSMIQNLGEERFDRLLRLKGRLKEIESKMDLLYNELSNFKTY